jgi:hypothetical protein
MSSPWSRFKGGYSFGPSANVIGEWIERPSGVGVCIRGTTLSACGIGSGSG